MYTKKTIGLDIKEFIWLILIRWKAAMLFAVIIAVAFGAVQYNQDLNAYYASVAAHKAAEEQKGLSKEDRINLILNSVPEEQRAEVKYVVAEKKWQKQQKEYLHNSLLMNTDPNNQKLLIVTYNVRANNQNDVYGLLQRFKFVLYKKETIDKIREIIAPMAEHKYIEELYYNEASVSEVSDSLLQVKIILPDDVIPEDVADVVKASIEGASDDMQKQFPHTLEPLGEEVAYFYNDKLASERREAFDNIINIENNIANNEITLSDIQKNAINEIMAVFDEQEETNTDDNTVAIEPKKPDVSKKHILLGFIMGICVYMFAYATILLLSGRMYSPKMVEDFLEARSLGVIYFGTKKKELGDIFSSRMLKNHHYFKDKEIQINRIAEASEAACRHAGINKLTLINTMDPSEGETVKTELKAVRKRLNDSEIKTDYLELKDISNEIKVLSIDNVVPVVGPGSKVSEIQNLKKLCIEYDVKIVGNIYVAKV